MSAYATAEHVTPVTCVAAHFTLMAPATWHVDHKGCVNPVQPLLVSPNKKVSVEVFVTPDRATHTPAGILAQLKAQAAHDKQTVHDAHNTTINGVVFSVGTFYLTDPSSKQDFVMYEAVTVHEHTAYAFLASAISTGNPSYAAALQAAVSTVASVRFLQH